MKRAMYLMVNKDTDDIHAERIEFDKDAFDQAIQRAERIITAPEPAVTLADDATNFTCKFCRFKSQCYETEAPAVSCRTCAHSTAEPSTPDSDAHWTCARFDRSVIPIETQYTGCESHVLHPDLVPWQRLDGPDAWTAIYVIDGREVANGEGDANVYASRELLNLDGRIVA